MKKLIFFFLLALVMGSLASCSDDGPDNPLPEHPAKAEFERIVKGRTWSASDVKYIDSRGNSFEWCGLAGGYTYQPSGFLLRDDDCLFAAYYYMADQRRHTLHWTYDEQKGMMYFYNASPNENDGCYIESLSEDEIVVRKDFGILQKWFYEMENGLEFDLEDMGADEGSYARCVYTPVAKDDEDSYWSAYPVIDGPVYGISPATK